MAQESIFGVSPESLQAAREAALQQRAMQFAQLDPFQQASAGMFMAGNRLGGALAQATGADSEMGLMKTRQSLLNGLDISDPVALRSAAQKAMQMNDYRAATELAAKATEAEKATKERNAAAREEQMRQELATLGAGATQEDVLKIVQKYASGDKILSTVQSSVDKEAAREQARVLQQERLAQMQQSKEAELAMRLQIAQMQGATQQQIAQMNIEGRKEIAAMMAEARKAAAQTAADAKKEGKGPAALKPMLQKQEGEDLEAIDKADLQVRALTPAIADLTPDPKTGKPKLELGPVQNRVYEAKLAAGNSDDQAKAYSRLKEAVDTAVNIQVSAEKGVQTDGDVLRFSKALIAAFGRNDTGATREALKRFVSAQEAARDKTKSRIEARRKAQGVESYYGAEEAPKAAPKVIKLD
jgi:hypothetical protein